MPFREFDSGSFTPDLLNTLYRAFDLAWADVSAEHSGETARTELARARLARALIAIAEGGVTDLEDLRAAAVAAFNANMRRG